MLLKIDDAEHGTLVNMDKAIVPAFSAHIQVIVCPALTQQCNATYFKANVHSLFGKIEDLFDEFFRVVRIGL